MTSSPGVLVPPPFIYLAGFAVGLALEAVRPTPDPALPVAVVVGVLGVLGWAALDGTAMRLFLRAGTPLPPSRPATTLVTDGPYRLTRNPIYLGMAVLHAGLAVAFGVLWALLTLVGVLVVIDRFVIAREERHLVAAFGADYERYRSSVRRWV